ncbi:hypothetical protein HYPSUDRAFT_118035, partial [Hypholoma sublateritium FD-334 SS-4]
TLRRHMQSRHKTTYLKWCKANNFDSMLPDDAKARRTEAHEALKQTRVGDHFTTVDPADDYKKLEPFSQDLFRDAAIQWLIETDQPISAFDHPTFQNMISVAARATKGV